MIRYTPGASPHLSHGERSELHYRVTSIRDIEDRLVASSPSSSADSVLICLLDILLTQEPSSFTEAVSLAMKRLPRGETRIPTKRDVLRAFRAYAGEVSVKAKQWLAKNLVTKRVRSDSGVLVVTVLTSPYPEVVEERQGREEGRRRKSEAAEVEGKRSEAMSTRTSEGERQSNAELNVSEDKTGGLNDNSLSESHPGELTESSIKPPMFSCKFDCFYCPNEPGQPRSYLRDEPAVLRANQNGFDPVLQFTDRCATLMENGHEIDKIEILILGGTWSSYEIRYRETFCRDLFFAANTFLEPSITCRARLSLSEEIKINETATCKIIGLTVETRPDCIDSRELIHFRNIGCTRVQLGIQHTDDEILRLVNRQATTKDAMNAIHLLKNTGFKVDAHLMPNLPGSDPVRDSIMLARMSQDAELQVDQIKVYPCEIVPFTKIEEWYRKGKYVPYDLESLLDVVIEFKTNIPPWIRLNRVVRDLPTTYQCASGVRKEELVPTDWRNTVVEEMKKRGVTCKCIRCREVSSSGGKGGGDPELMVRPYEASCGGMEYFISFENSLVIFAFCRLRVPAQNDMSGTSIFPELRNAALVRELHVYGELVKSNNKSSNVRAVQHTGMGLRLLAEAERLVLENHGDWVENMIVISGVGAREYYRLQGWHNLYGGVSMEQSGGGYYLGKKLARKIRDEVDVKEVVEVDVKEGLVEEGADLRAENTAVTVIMDRHRKLLVVTSVGLVLLTVFAARKFMRR